MVNISINDKIAVITICRPDQLNALSSKVISDLEAAFISAEKDDNVRAVILTGQGKKAFIAGADIKEMSSFNLKEAESYSKNGQSLTKYIENYTKPVIASVNGFALGGGCEFAMSCHIRYAADNAKFGQPEVGLGLIAGFGGTQRLSRLVGKGHALEILLSGKMISASEAESIGLINKVFPSDDLFEEVMDLAKKISQNAPISVKHTIKLVNNGLDSSLNEGLDLESKAFGDIFSTDDQKEGITAFIEKRSANFKGT